jgi:hypothetical protein
VYLNTDDVYYQSDAIGWCSGTSRISCKNSTDFVSIDLKIIGSI